MGNETNLSSAEEVVQSALDFGFSYAGMLNVDSVKLYPEIREMCNPKQCKVYGTNWTCPPACGSLEENTQQLKAYNRGVIVQTTCNLKSNFDSKGMMDGGKKHMENFRSFRRQLLERFPNMLALGAGGCNVCESCTYPDEPCRQPNEALSSMEAYGMHVNEVCKQNGMKAHYGDLTLTYVGCYILE